MNNENIKSFKIFHHCLMTSLLIPHYLFRALDRILSQNSDNIS